MVWAADSSLIARRSKSVRAPLRLLAALPGRYRQLEFN